MNTLAIGIVMVSSVLLLLPLTTTRLYANPAGASFPQQAVTGATTVFLPIIYGAGVASADAPPLRSYQYEAEGANPPALSTLPPSTRCQSFIRFDNFSSFTAIIYWQNSAGIELFYNAVESGRHYWQHTFQGNQWRVRDEGGRLLKTISAEPCENKRIELFEEDFPACGFIRRVVLWNLDEDVPLVGYDNLGDNSSIELATSPLVQLRVEIADVVESISFTVNDEQIIINDTPFGYPSANLPWELLPIVYNIKIEAYRKDNAQGRLCELRELTLTGVGGNGLPTATPTVSPTTTPGTITPTATATGTVTPATPTATPTTSSPPTPTPPICSARIEHLRFVNLATGLPIAGYDPIVAGQSYDLAGLPPDFALDALVTPGAESLLFTVNGVSSLEDFPPYRYPGGDLEGWRPVAGNYAVRVVAYSQDGAIGAVCDILVLNFVLIGVPTATATPTPTLTATVPVPPTATSTQTSTPTPSPTVSPTPSPTVSPTPSPTVSPTPTAPAACLGDFVWHDRNGNGLQGANDGGLAAVDIYLWRDDNRDGNPDRIVRTATTTNNGLYSFCNLEAGQYIIEFASATCINTLPNVGSNDAIDSDADPERGGRTAPIVFDATVANNTVDAGFICMAASSE